MKTFLAVVVAIFTLLPFACKAVKDPEYQPRSSAFGPREFEKAEVEAKQDGTGGILTSLLGSKGKGKSKKPVLDDSTSGGQIVQGLPLIVSVIQDEGLDGFMKLLGELQKGKGLGKFAGGAAGKNRRRRWAIKA